MTAPATPWHLPEDEDPRFLEFAAEPRAAVRTASLAGGRAVGYGNIFTADGVLVDDATPRYRTGCFPDRHTLLSGECKIPPARYIDGRVFALIGMWPDTYYHWLYHILPKALLVDRAAWDFVYTRRATRFQEEYLAALGIEADRVLPAGPDTHVQARELIVASNLTWLPAPVCASLAAFGRRICRGPVAGARRRRIYVRREEAPNARGVENEAELLRFLGDEGFESILLESLPVAAQMELFAEADFVAGPHGSGIGNAVFGSPPLGVMEFFDPGYVHPCNWAQLAGLGIRYGYVLGRGGTPAGSGFLERMRRPMTVDVDKVRRLYSAMCEARR